MSDQIERPIYACGNEHPSQSLFHIVKEAGGDNTVAVLCGYPVLPDFPRHSGWFQPSTMYSGPTKPLGVCAECERLHDQPSALE